MNAAPDFSPLQLALVGDTDVVIRRDFSHPPSKVWRAITDPALIPRWMASPDAMLTCEIDLRPGGRFRYVWDEFAFSGPITAVDAPHHLATVEHFSADPAYRVAVTVDLAAQGTGTRMTHLMRYPDAATRAAAVAAGFTDGMDAVYDRLEALLTAE
jgi:uncharacterized protein YndB with AHSA1/START domain